MEANNPAISLFAEVQSMESYHTWGAVCGSDSAAALVNDRAVTDADLVGVTVNPSAADMDKKVAMLRLTYRKLDRSGYWHLPGAVDRLDRIIGTSDAISFEAFRAQLRLWFKGLAVTKGRRHSQTQTDSARATGLKANVAGDQAPRQGDPMSLLLTVKDVKPISEGTHNAVITKVEERESKFSDSRSETYIALTFELTDDVNAGRQLAKGFSPSLSSKSKLGQLWKRFKGELPVGKALDVEDLIGERCQIVVVHEQGTDGETHERIVDVFKPH